MGGWLAQEGVLQHPEDRPGLGAELKVPARLRRAGEGGDGIRRSLDIGKQVEPPAVLPGMPCQHARRPQRQMRVQRGADGIEQAVEDPPHGEDGRSGIDLLLADTDAPHLSPGSGSALQNNHPHSLGGQPQGRR